jgi:hypothetical protein
MPGDDDRVAMVKAQLAKPDLAPEKRAKFEAWLAARSAAASAPKPANVPTVRGSAPRPAAEPEASSAPGMGDLRVAEQPKRAGEVLGAPLEKPKSPLELAKEGLAAATDNNPALASASKRRTLYAEPLYQSTRGDKAPPPFVHYEPKPENIAAELESYASSLPFEQRDEVTRAAASIRKDGKKSKHYQEAADRIWLEVRTEFQRDDLPVQRVEYAPASDLQTGLHKYVGMPANATLHAFDSVLAGGALSASFPTLGQDFMSRNGVTPIPEQEAVLKRLRERGVLPEGSEARGQEAFDSPWLGGAVALGGLVMGMRGGGGGGLGGMATRLGTKTESALAKRAPAWLNGTTLGSRMTRAAAGGAVGGVVAGGGSQAITETSEALRGESDGLGEALGDVAERAGVDGALGGVFGAGGTYVGDKLTTGMKSLGQSMQERLRLKGDKRGADVIQAEESGAGSTSFLGVMKRSPEGEALEREALEPVTLAAGVRVGQTKAQAATRPVADAALTSRFNRTEAEEKLMGRNNQEGYARLANKRVDVSGLGQKLIDHLDSIETTPFTEQEVYLDALGRMTKARLLPTSSPVFGDGRIVKMTAERARKLGIKVDSPPGRVADGDYAVAVEFVPQSAEQLDKATRGLGQKIKWGKEAGEKDAELRDIYSVLMQTRERFGSAWAQVKKQHDGILRQRAEDMEALGFPANHELKMSDMERSRVHALFEGFGSADIPRKKALLRLLADHPDMQKRANLHAGNEAIDRLKAGASTDGPALAGAAGGAVLAGPAGGLGGAVLGKTLSRLGQNADLRFDPVFGAMRRLGGEGEARSAAMRQKVQEFVGPGVEIPDSLLDYVGQMLNISTSTEERADGARRKVRQIRGESP